jgi:hypothetical protein
MQFAGVFFYRFGTFRRIDDFIYIYTKIMDLSEIYEIVEFQFGQQCTASSSSKQTISFRNTKMILRDNCKMKMENTAILDSSCQMADIADAIAEEIVKVDLELAKEIQSVQDKKANAQCDADDCVNKVTTAVKKKLLVSCASDASAVQTIKMTDSTVFCDGNSEAGFGQQSEVRASCIKSVLRNAQELRSPEKLPEKLPKKTSPKNNSDRNKLLLLVVALFFIVIIVKKKKTTNTNE